MADTSDEFKGWVAPPKWVVFHDDYGQPLRTWNLGYFEAQLPRQGEVIIVDSRKWVICRIYYYPEVIRVSCARG